MSATGAPGAAARITAIVVTYNRLAHLRLTLERLLAQSVDQVLVVDNCSTDGTRDWLAGLADSRVYPLLLEKNGGGAVGFETGLREAIARFSPDWCLLLDDDARPEPGALDRFRAVDWQGALAVSAAVYFPSGAICEMNRPWHNPFASWNIFWASMLGGRAAFHLADSTFAGTETAPIDGASFVGLFLSRQAVERIGYPDGRLFLYGDDVHYTLSLSQSGAAITFDPNIRFVHDCSTQDADGIFRPMWKTYYRHRNLGFVYRLAAGPILFWPVILLMRVKWFRDSLKLRGRERQIHRRMCSLAFWDTIRNRVWRSHAEVCQRAEGV